MESHEIRMKVAELLRTVLHKPNVSSEDLRRAAFDLLNLSLAVLENELSQEVAALIDAVFLEKGSPLREKPLMSRES